MSRILDLKVIKKNSFGRLDSREDIIILVDKFPDFTYDHIGNYLYAETVEGFVSVYFYSEKSRDGFGNSEVVLKLNTGKELICKGNIWDITNQPKEIPKVRPCLMTDDSKAYDENRVYRQGLITESLYKEIVVNYVG